MSSYESPETLPEKSKTIRSHRDLIVWQKAMELTMIIYDITERFPKEEVYGLTSQMRRSATSIPSNIAEGRRRSSKKEFALFLHYAFGSAAELETQIDIAKLLPKNQRIDFKAAEGLLSEIMKMLYVMMNKLRPLQTKNHSK